MVRDEDLLAKLWSPRAPVVCARRLARWMGAQPLGKGRAGLISGVALALARHRLGIMADESPRFEMQVMVDEDPPRVKVASANDAARAFYRRHTGSLKDALERVEKRLTGQDVSRATVLSAMAPFSDALVDLRRRTGEDADLAAVEVDKEGATARLGTRLR